MAAKKISISAMAKMAYQQWRRKNENEENENMA
jgi:hypothetical protein